MILEQIKFNIHKLNRNKYNCDLFYQIFINIIKIIFNH